MGVAFESQFEKEQGIKKTLALTEKGQKVAQVEYAEYQKPLFFIYLDQITVPEKHRGEKHGKKALEMFQNILEADNVPGVLYNAMKEDSPATGMYERSGWLPLEGYEKWMTYNASEEDQEFLKLAIDTYWS